MILIFCGFLHYNLWYKRIGQYIPLYPFHYQQVTNLKCDYHWSHKHDSNLLRLLNNAVIPCHYLDWYVIYNYLLLLVVPLFVIKCIYNVYFLYSVSTSSIAYSLKDFRLLPYWYFQNLISLRFSFSTMILLSIAFTIRSILSLLDALMPKYIFLIRIGKSALYGFPSLVVWTILT